MPDYKTPGVYIQEISTLPSSVAAVETAIPVFIGYTKQRVQNDETFAINTPKRITSMIEFVELFGGAYNEYYNVSISNPAAGETFPTVGIVFRETGGNHSPYNLFHQVRMFYANGGGPCYIVSVGDFIAVASNPTDPLPAAAALPTNNAIVKDALKAGLAACKEIDEITLLCIPEAVHLSDANRKELYDDMLAQSAELQDRFAIMDVLSDSGSTVFNDGNRFRSNDVSSDNLKYGAAYYPELETLLSFPYNDDLIHVSDTRTGALYNNRRLSSIKSGKAVDGTDINASATLRIKVVDSTNIGFDSVTINGVPFTENSEFVGPFATNSDVASALALAIDGSGDPLLSDISAIVDPGSTTTVLVTSDTPGPAGNNLEGTYTDSGSGPAITLQGVGLSPGESSISANFEGGSDGIDLELYNHIKSELDKNKINLYPCGSMAGIYARVDNERGVWKAPANVSINQVKDTIIQVTREEQANLNVDATSGKSINAIRNFTGKGILVWGARTLAGNDNEWRYVPVRRFYNFAEESIKKATEFVVFEPNDAKTWVRTKAMIENFLLQLWSAGALAGATAEDAFFVKVGLGETMTALDILEGRLNIEIGMAVVRPAEFIILKFSHKMQES